MRYLDHVVLSATDLRGYITDPVGSYVATGNCITWCASRSLAGALFWGAPESGDVANAARLWKVHRGFETYDLILDLERLRFVHPDALRIVAAHIQEELDAGLRSLRRQAIVVPADVTLGAPLVGLPVVLACPHEWRSFDRIDPALAWLDRADAGDVYPHVLHLAERTMETCDTLARVRGHLLERPKAGTLKDVSRTLGRSPRSLQRDLKRHGTSLREEVRIARARAAAVLLAASDLKVEAIAAEVGYTSTAHFAEAFAHVLGETPLAYRLARRR